jgi:hypothetical protein
MSRLIVLAAALVMFAFPMDAAAQRTNEPPSKIVDAAALQRMMSATLPYRKLADEMVELTLEAMDMAHAAMELAEREPNRAEVDRWYADTVAPIERRRADILRRTRALGPMPRDVLAMVSDRYPQAFEPFRALPERTNVMSKSCSDFILEMTGLARQAARGNAKALDTLPKRLMRGTVVLIELENADLRIAMGVMSEQEPEYFFSQSVLASNAAMVVLLNGILDLVADRDVDLKVISVRVAAQAKVADVAARRLRASNAIAAAGAAELAGSTPLERASLELVGLYAEAANVEDDMVRQLDRIAALLADEDLEGVFDSMEDFEKIADRRQALQQQRIKTVAEMDR